MRQTSRRSSKNRKCSFCRVRDARPKQWTCKVCHAATMKAYRAEKREAIQ